ncbi:hypothetical protein GCM10028795_18310 [Lysobacter olei]
MFGVGMFNGSFVTVTLLVALLLGGSLMAYLLLVKQRQLIVAGGIATLAGMRWREFSRFVIEALQAQGFETHPDGYNPDQTDLRLTRGGQTWLLSCRQGPATRITPHQVGELNDAVRLNGAAGGILVTLGTFEPQARRLATDIDTLDGQALWPMIGPLLPPSVHQSLRDKAKAAVTRTAALGWAGAVALGLGMATVIAPEGGSATTDTVASNPTQHQPRSGVAAKAQTAATPASVGTPQPEATLSATQMPEEAQRKDVIEQVGRLPGVDSAIWSTRSTLLVQLSEDASQKRVDEICAVVKRYEVVRTSRLHLQPPAGSEARVRFLQCATF